MSHIVSPTRDCHSTDTYDKAPLVSSLKEDVAAICTFTSYLTDIKGFSPEEAVRIVHISLKCAHSEQDSSPEKAVTARTVTSELTDHHTPPHLWIL